MTTNENFFYAVVDEDENPATREDSTSDTETVIPYECRELLITTKAQNEL